LAMIRALNNNYTHRCRGSKRVVTSRRIVTDLIHVSDFDSHFAFPSIYVLAQAFLREIELMKSFDCPNVVRYFDGGASEASSSIVRSLDRMGGSIAVVCAPHLFAPEPFSTIDMICLCAHMLLCMLPRRSWSSCPTATCTSMSKLAAASYRGISVSLCART
jgi:hypothetical protein